MIEDLTHAIRSWDDGEWCCSFEAELDPSERGISPPCLIDAGFRIEMCFKFLQYNWLLPAVFSSCHCIELL